MSLADTIHGDDRAVLNLPRIGTNTGNNGMALRDFGQFAASVKALRWPPAQSFRPTPKAPPLRPAAKAAHLRPRFHALPEALAPTPGAPA